MKISIEWLKEYVDLFETPEVLKQDLSMAGILVESILQGNGDTALEIEVTSNRPDCLSHIGIAREVAALYGRSCRKPKLRRKLGIGADKIPYSVEILDPDLCPRYVGLVLDGIRVEASPPWMQRRLDAAGMRPVNNIVDITNYVLLEMGHPLHAFDFEQLQQGKIVVARARQGQKIVTLDGVERELDGEMLLINDGSVPVAIAGVMGGLHSEISLTTKTVLLECAYFLPASVRRTSKKLGLATEASYRFERGADWENTVPAIARTCWLIERLAGGRIAGGIQDVYPRRMEPVKIELLRERAEALLGVRLSDDFVESTLKRLNFRLARMRKGAWQVTCPTYRADMELEADLIEELARFFGYQNIPTTIPPSTSAGIPSPVFPHENAARHSLLGLGYCEAVNLSFAPASEDQEFPVRGSQRVTIRNPLTEETQFLRTTLAAGLIRSAKHNFNHGIDEIRLFEIGKVFRLGPEGLPVERNTLGLLGTGGFAGRNWHHSSGTYDFFHMKGTIETVLRAMRSEPYEIIPARDTDWLNPADASAILIGGTRLGIMGSLHPALEAQYKLKQAVYLAEIDFEELARHAFTPVRYAALAKYPAVERDLSIVVGRDVSYQDAHKGILGLGISEIVAIELLDVYEGEKIPEGKLSMTLRLTFQDRERTLTVDRIQGFIDKILAFLAETMGAMRR